MLRRMRDAYEAHFLCCDLIVSVILAVVLAYLYESFRAEGFLEAVASPELYGTIATIAGTLLGFVVTGLAVILSVGDSPALRVLRRSKRYPEVYSVFFGAGCCFAILMLLALTGMVLERSGPVAGWIPYMVTWGVLLCLFRLGRCFWVLHWVVKLHVQGEQNLRHEKSEWHCSGG